MAISRISSQDASGTSTTTSVSATYPGATTSGNLLIAVVAGALGQTYTTNGITISGWTQIDSCYILTVFGSKDGEGVIFGKIADGTETTITAHSTASEIAMGIFITEYSGASLTTDGAPFTSQNVAAVTSGSTPNLTTSNADDLIIPVGAVVSLNGPTNATWAISDLVASVNADSSTGYTNYLLIGIGEHIVSSTQSGFNDTMSWTGSGSGTASGGLMVVALQAASAPPPAANGNMLMVM
jgi:hypothetical protein